MIELTEFQHEVLAFMARFDLIIYAEWPTDRYREFEKLEYEGLLTQTNEIMGLFKLTEQGELMFKCAGTRATQ
jgi:hypothetical protein